MGSSLKEHIFSLNKSLFYKLVRAFGCFSWFSSSRKEDPSFFSLNRHKICRYLYIHDIRAIRVSPEVVHKQVMRVVDEEVQRVNHVSVVVKQRHFYSLVYCLLNFHLHFFSVGHQRYRPLMLVFFEKITYFFVYART